MNRAELIVSRNYRMLIIGLFSISKKILYRTSNIEYLNIYLFCVFPSKFLRKSENLPEIPKILQKFRKFSGNSENWPKFLKIRRKFLKKKVFSEAKISYRYRIVSNKKAKYRIDIVSSRKKAYCSGVVTEYLKNPKCQNPPITGF